MFHLQLTGCVFNVHKYLGRILNKYGDNNARSRMKNKIRMTNTNLHIHIRTQTQFWCVYRQDVQPKINFKQLCRMHLH